MAYHEGNLTHWSVAGAIVAATGAAPDHWLAEILHAAHAPHLDTPLWLAAIDYRLAAVVAGLTIIVGDNLWRNHRRRLPAPPASEAPAGPTLPDKPSIAVLAFTNMSDGPDQEYFSDGIAEDIITSLSQISWLFVIARNSSFTFKGRAVDVKQIGRELGVRYVLEGSVRRSGDRLRVTGQLIEAATGAHIWAERYDRAIDNIFEIQDEVTRAVVIAIDSVLAAKERDRVGRISPDKLGPWELYHRGMLHVYRYTREDFHVAEKYLREAAALDPSSAAVQTGLAQCLLNGGWMFEPAKRSEWMPAGLEHARIATTLNPSDSMAHAFYGLGLSNADDRAGGVRETALAVKLNPNNAWAQALYGGISGYDGHPAEGLRHIQLAMRLSPLDPIRWLWSHMAATLYYFVHDYESSLAAGKDFIRLAPNAWASYRHCFVALTEMGRDGEAKYYADILCERFAKELVYFATVRFGEWREEDHARYIASIAKGGLVVRDGALARVDPRTASDL